MSHDGGNLRFGQASAYEVVEDGSVVDFFRLRQWRYPLRGRIRVGNANYPSRMLNSGKDAFAANELYKAELAFLLSGRSDMEPRRRDAVHVSCTARIQAFVVSNGLRLPGKIGFVHVVAPDPKNERKNCDRRG